MFNAHIDQEFNDLTFGAIAIQRILNSANNYSVRYVRSDPIVLLIIIDSLIHRFALAIF